MLNDIAKDYDDDADVDNDKLSMSTLCPFSIFISIPIIVWFSEKQTERNTEMQVIILECHLWK